MPPTRPILLHLHPSGTPAMAVYYARTLAAASGAALNILYMVEDPLAADWTAETSMALMPRIHDAMQEEAREQLGRLMSEAEQARFQVELVIGTGNAEDEVSRQVERLSPGLLILGTGRDEGLEDLARGILGRVTCSMLVVRDTL